MSKFLADRNKLRFTMKHQQTYKRLNLPDGCLTGL